MKNFIFNIECPYGCTTQAGSLSLLKKVERLNVSLRVFNTKIILSWFKKFREMELTFFQKIFLSFSTTT